MKMSAQRSSPGSECKLIPPNPVHHYNSDSALDVPSKSDCADNYFNITKRQKRTFGDLTGQTVTSITEIKTMFAEFTLQQDQKFDLLNTTLNTIMTQNQVIQNSVTALTAQHQDLLDKIQHLEEENCEYKKRITTLDSQINQLEMNARCTTIELRNVPKQQIDNKNVLTNIIQKLGSSLKLETPIVASEIRDIYRTRSDAIVVEFTTTLRKESVVSKFKTFNKSRREVNEPQLNSQHIGVPGEARSLFISEYLTSKARRLFYAARLYVKDKKLVAAWTSYGKVYVKKEEASSPLRVFDEPALDKLVL